jgi:hypothetical protein
MQIDPSQVYMALGFVVGLPALWCLALGFAAWISGWRRLAFQYAATSPFGGDVARFLSARIQFTNYSGVLKLAASETGMYLALIGVYRPFHRPLLIPWSEIEAEMRGRSIWPRSGLRLTFPSVPRTAIAFYGRAIDIVLPHVEQKARAANSGS